MSNGRIRGFGLGLAFTVVVVAAGCAGGDIRRAAPEGAGIASAPLKEFSAVLQAKVDAGEIPGAVFLVARDGKVVWENAVGWRDREAKAPMTTDSIFRIMSMTKPVVAVATLILVEEGKLRLDDAVSRYLPEFAQMQVGVEKAGASNKPELVLEPARAPITVLDLMRHTSGMTYAFTGRSLVRDRYNAANLQDPAQTNADFAAKLAKLPLQWQPGQRFEYSHSYDVLARVVEVASGTGLAEFIAARITGPLGMKDSGFAVAAGSQARIAEPQVIAATGKRPEVRDMTKPARWASGGGGMVATAEDYARFCQMLLDGGTLNGVRIISKESVALMVKDHLPALQPSSPFFFSPTVDNGNGYGLGVVVRTAQGTKGIPGSIGDISWSGSNGTYFWVDPKERLVGILMLQAPFVSVIPLWRSERDYVYRALGR